MSLFGGGGSLSKGLFLGQVCCGFRGVISLRLSVVLGCRGDRGVFEVVRQ